MCWVRGGRRCWLFLAAWLLFLPLVSSQENEYVQVPVATWEAIKVEIQGLKVGVQLARQEQTLLQEKHQKQETLWTTAYTALTESWNEQSKELTTCRNWSKVWIGVIIVETVALTIGGLVLWLR